MSETPQGSMWASYARLLRYTRPYRWRVYVGLACVMVGAGSYYGMLRLSPNLFRPFAPANKAAVEAPAVAAESPAVATVPEGGEAAALPGDWRKFLEFAERLHIPVLDAGNRITWQFLVVVLIGLPVMLILRGAASFFSRYLLRWIGTRVCLDLRNALFSHLQHQSLKYFGRSDVGRLISGCTNDAAIVESMLATTLADAVRAPLEIAVLVCFVVVFSIEQGIAGFVGIMLVVFPLCIMPVVLMGRYVRKFTARALNRVADLVSHMHENFTGVRVVKAYHMEDREIRKFTEMNGRYFHSVIRALWAELMMQPLMEAVAVMLAAAFIVVCYARGIQIWQIAPIALAAVAIYRPLKQLTRIQPSMERGAAALDRIFGILDVDDRLPEAPNPVRIEGLRERIVFEGVGFSYDVGGNPVLADIELEITRGSVVALVGETGSGKTTMANLLARFYDPTAGRILWDGIDLRTIEVASLRRLTTIVTQETILFNTTIAENIAYGADGATREQIEEAARQANAHAFIVADPAGYERVVGEKGFVLSGGERQRVALARAILRNPPILILDEATSALDTVTEALVQEAIARVMANRTVFAIAHRLSTVRNADQILVMDKGRIVERGTHDVLYARGGRYRRLCDMQLVGR